MKYASITLSGRFAETEPQTRSLQAAAASNRFRFDTFLLAVEKILAGRNLRRVLIDCRPDFAPGLFGGAEAVREQLARLSRAGKEVHFYAREYDQLRLYLASACTSRLIHPLGRLSFLGLARPFLFFRNALDKQKVEPEIIRRGEYKSAGDRFRTDSLDKANAEQYQVYLDRLMEETRVAVEQGFNKSRSDLRELLKGTILTAEAARQEGWIDEIGTLSHWKAEWKREKLKEQKLKKLGSSYGKGRKEIAVLIFEGSIIDGESKQLPLLGQALGDSSFVPHIRQLAEDKSVKGVVLRINSGGGSATASEEILSALRELREKKPLVVSMSELAGSGGYWLALEAERIFAQSTTLTGSIGVITLLFTVQKLLKRVGITAETLRTAPFADLGSALRSLTKEERRMMQGLVDEVYHAFVQKVAKARGRGSREIEEVARGRVWSGFDAVTQGLVDEVGGVTQAIAYLQGDLGLRRCTVSFHPRLKRSLLQKLLMKGSPVASLRLPGALSPGMLLKQPFSSTTPLLLMPESLSLEELLASPVGMLDI
jgi:protease-4